MEKLIFFYLAGCAVVFVASVLQFIVFHATQFLVGAGCYWNNAAKIGLFLSPTGQLTDKKNSIGDYLFIVGLGILFSWINVPFNAWALIRTILGAFTYVTTKHPESFLKLRFPLVSNPDLEAEAVWAHLYSIAVVSQGQLATTEAIKEDLSQTKGRVPTFMKEKALAHLSQLATVDPDLIKEVRLNIAA